MGPKDLDCGKFYGAVLYEAFREQYFEGAALLFQKRHLVVKSILQPLGLREESLRSLLVTFFLYHKILRQHPLCEPYPIVGEEELAAVGEHLLTVNFDDEWFAVPRSDIDGGLFI